MRVDCDIYIHTDVGGLELSCVCNVYCGYGALPLARVWERRDCDARMMQRVCTTLAGALLGLSYMHDKFCTIGLRVPGANQDYLFQAHTLTYMYTYTNQLHRA